MAVVATVIGKIAKNVKYFDEGTSNESAIFDIFIRGEYSSKLNGYRKLWVRCKLFKKDNLYLIDNIKKFLILGENVLVIGNLVSRIYNTAVLTSEVSLKLKNITLVKVYPKNNFDQNNVSNKDDSNVSDGNNISMKEISINNTI